MARQDQRRQQSHLPHHRVQSWQQRSGCIIIPTEVPVARLVAFCLQHQRFLPLDGTLYMAHHTIYARLVPVPKIALFQYSTVLVDIYYPC